MNSYLFKYTGIARSGLTFDFVWHMFSNVLNKIGSKSDPYVLDTVRHLIKLFIGANPGFSPALNDTGGPFSYVKDVYMDHYNLQYAPTIMEPKNFGDNRSNRFVYYSLHYPTFLESSPRKRKPESLVTDLIQIRSLITIFKRFFDEGKIYLGESLINDTMPGMQFDFFHFGEAKYNGIRSNNDIPIQDEQFVIYKGQKFAFAAASTFVQNCIRISSKS